ncbi:MAG TPA: di-trans,poly-cis-decaprenylcistransferase [Microvirga sp.]|jgi:undecaprenyl diphosphate synthase|nr:di-trans,poly-cis-decaprenylcistransferase [Microvirga sp.]
MQSIGLLHVGIIMDGNGRWAQGRGLPRLAGHEAGVQAIRRIVECAPSQGVGILTLYAFSADNWRRPQAEVTGLMGLLRLYLRRETARLARSGIRLSVIGRRDRLPEGLADEIARAEAATAAGRALHLRVAIDYSSREAILAAAVAATPADATRVAFSRLLAGGDPVPDLDLVIRTSGEQRLSDFMLWESAYAELYFTPRLWPDFDAGDLAAALTSFGDRQRRYGGLVPALTA